MVYGSWLTVFEILSEIIVGICFDLFVRSKLSEQISEQYFIGWDGTGGTGQVGRDGWNKMGGMRWGEMGRGGRTG